MLETENIIEIENLTKFYKERDIFKCLKGNKVKRGIENINLKVNKGEILSIIGLNGAGKTTLLKCLLGLLEYDKGKIKVFGKEKLEVIDKSKIGYLPEISYYPKDLKLFDLMYFYGELYDMKKQKILDNIDEVLEIVKLHKYKKERLNSFSKGMLQKVGIAQAILNKPDLLFLDEPMSGLDPLARREVIELLEYLKAKGTTIFLNTHILNDIERIGERVVVIHEGKLKEEFDLRLEKKEFSLEEYFINTIKGDTNV